MRKLKLLILIFLMFSFIMPTKADVEYKFESGNFHVVYIKDNKVSTSCDNVSTIKYDSSNIELIKSFDSYDEALKFMNDTSSTEDKIVAIVGERKNTSDNYVYKIINSDYALVDLNTTNTTMTTSLVYTGDVNNQVYTYINGHGAFGGVDAAFIDYSNGDEKSDIKSRVNMKISGVTGWINSLLYLNKKAYNGYEIIPINLVRSPSYYYVSDEGNLIHRLSKKITANNCYSTYINLGPAPSSLSKKDNAGNMMKYYSYDGNYFYKSLEDMLSDYKNNSVDKSVNVIPYYNYYMYSPARIDSNATADDIKAFLESRGYNSNDKSKLYGEELTFIDAQQKYSTNALMMLSTAINESGWGTSYLAKNKKNLFGHNAVDSDVYNSANGYNTVADGIYRHAYYYINTLYSETKDASGLYNGSHLGNKNSGINVKYAADPYWGEKIAAVYRSIDAYIDYKDLNSHTIGIKTSSYAAPIYSEPNKKSTILYTLKSKIYEVTNMPVYILGKVSGEEIDGNNVWYKIQTDALLNEDRTDVIQNSKVDTYYNRENNYGYVHSSYITLMDENVKKIYTRKDGLFGLHNLSLDENNNVVLTGYLAISGMDNTKNKNITYDLILKDEINNITYEKKLDRILDDDKIPYQVPSIDKYSNEYSWFNGVLDFSDVEEGNYSLYVRARSSEFEAIEVLSNMLSIDIATKFNKDNRGYQFRTNYYLKTIPVELFIRNNGLISDKLTPTKDNMINQYENISLEDNSLIISGSSFNVGGDYSTTTEVKRNIIFENIKTFERKEFDLGYIDNGTYQITLIVPDKLDKTRAWFNNKIDISSLEKGTYAIYIKTESNIEDYGELNDIFLRELDTTMNIDDKKYSLKINKEQRFRLELIVE